MNIINIYKQKEGFVESKKQKNYFKSYFDISEKFGATKLGFHISIIEPKNFSYPYHYHEAEEELFLVLEGEAIVRCNNEFRRVKEGDLVHYPTGSLYAHNLYNPTDRPFKILQLSVNSPDDDVCHYPDSRKVTSEKGYLQNGQVVGYFKDEEDPAKYWPESILRGEI